MTPEIVLQHAINAVSLGGTYALLALGLAVVFSVMGLVNWAHGELITVTGYALLFLIATSLPFPIAALFAVVAAALTALLMERIAFRPLRRASGETLLLASFALSFMLQILFQDLISARQKTVPLPDALAGTITVGAFQVGLVQTISIVGSLLILLLLSFFLRRTMLGISMRAAAQDFGVARLMGIRADRVIAVSFALAGLLAGAAAVLWIAQRGTVDPFTGNVPVVKAFIAAMIGGLGSLSGAVAAGYLLGIVEVSAQAYLPGPVQPFRDAFVWALVLGVLLIRPNGLFTARATR